MLEEAKGAYTKGFSPGHPKVAWALEGMAKVYQKVGDLRSAQEAMGGALAIRRSLHTHDAGKHLFSKELQQGERTKVEIEQKRLKLRLGLQAKIRKGMLAEAVQGGGGRHAARVVEAERARSAVASECATMARRFCAAGTIL